MATIYPIDNQGRPETTVWKTVKQ